MKALLIIDMLNDFVMPGASLEVPGAIKIIPNIKREIKKARDSGYPVIFVNDAHKPDDPEFKVWPKHAVDGTKGAGVVSNIAPTADDTVIKKCSYSGFYNTRLEEVLKDSGVDSLIITGVVTNICVLYTAVDALMRCYEVQVPEDCVCALTHEDHKFALRQIKQVLKPRQL